MSHTTIEYFYNNAPDIRENCFVVIAECTSGYSVGCYAYHIPNGLNVLYDGAQLCAQNPTAESLMVYVYKYNASTAKYAYFNGVSVPAESTSDVIVVNEGYAYHATEKTLYNADGSVFLRSATDTAEIPTDKVTIQYNGAIIATLTSKQTATLKCKGDNVKMHTDIVVNVPELGGESVPEWDGSYTISGGTISFTIAGTSYQAEEGMTWADWCKSEYNTGGYITQSGYILTGNKNYYVKYNGSWVYSTDTINDSYAYSWYMESG